MKKSEGHPAQRTLARRQKASASRRLTRAWEALSAAADSDAWVRATYRLMLATAPGAFASAALRCSRVDVALWLNSDGARLRAAESPKGWADHPGIPYVMQRPGLKVLPTRGVLPPPEELEKTYFYRDFMVPFDWRHAVGLCFWNPIDGMPMLECVMSVHRSAAEGDFSDEEIAALGALHAGIDRARRRVTKLEEERFARSSFEHFADRLPMPVALLSWDLRPLYHNQPARESAAVWRGGFALRQQKTSRAAFTPPPELLAACREMQTEWRDLIRAGSQDERVIERFVAPAGAPGLQATVRLLFLTGSPLGDPTFMILFTEPGPAPPARPPNFAALQRLTPTERAVATLAAALKSNSEIAAALGRSVGTVKAQLHAACRKLGVRTRAELASWWRG